MMMAADNALPYLPVELWAKIILTATTDLKTFAALTSVCRGFRHFIWRSSALKAFVLIRSSHSDRPFDMYNSDLSPRWLGAIPSREEILLHIVRIAGAGEKHNRLPEGTIRYGRNPYLALHLAVENNMLRVASMLLDDGVDSNVESYKGTPLGIAAQRNNSVMTQLLLQHGADPHLNKPLSIACSNGSLEVVEILLPLQTPALVSEALFCAIDARHVDIVKILLREGHANPNSPQGRWIGWRPIHQAIHSFRLRRKADKDEAQAASVAVERIVRVLLDAGADARMACIDGIPEDMARRKGLPTVADTLRAASSSSPCVK